MASSHRAALSLTLLAVGCRAPTAIELQISTDISCQDLRGTAISVHHASAEQIEPATVTTRCEPDGTIGTLVVLPSSSSDESLRVRVVSALGVPVEQCAGPDYGPRCIVSRRRLRFLPHETLRLPIQQQADCAGIACGETDTCRQGVCQSAEVNLDDCQTRGACDPVSTSTTALQVGPGRPFATPCDAIAASSPGAQIDIYPGTYQGSCLLDHSLYLRGVGERPVLVADSPIPNQKGILAIEVSPDSDLIVENLEFRGAAVPDKNGAGIRFQGRNLTVRKCAFRDSEVNLMANLQDGEIRVEGSEFSGNTGFASLYVEGAARATVRSSWFHDSKAGSAVRILAAQLDLVANRITSEQGTEQQLLALPRGAPANVVGNLLHRSNSSPQTSPLLSFCDPSCPADSRLILLHNTFVDTPAGAGFLTVGSSAQGSHLVSSNLLFGSAQLPPASPLLTLQRNQVLPLDQLTTYLLSPDTFDDRLTPAALLAIDQGAELPSGLSFPLVSYVHPVSLLLRTQRGSALDVGAYEAGP